MVFTMIVEQTKKYRKRICYEAQTNTFYESEYDSLAFARSFLQPYGWIKESGTPPGPHWDVILMTENDYTLGDEVPVKVVGLFKRADGDHKYIAVEAGRGIDDYGGLSETERDDLKRLYPRAGAGEGWFGRGEAERAMRDCAKAL
ncbi:MAG: hypothetical protein ABFC62_10635 [Clostridiaceae bacterium]|nr:hypothetical protein [Eubacteriales bacterium]